MDVSGRVVVVTGGASGIGAALCRGFRAGAAAAIVIADVDTAGAQRVANETGGVAVTADVSQEGSVRALIERVVAQHGRVDVYCSNAGVGLGGGADAPDAVWQRSWEVNVMAHVYAARAVLPGFLQRGEGYFVATISAAALLNHLLAAPYAASKAAALSFVEWLAITYGDHGVHVSAVCPQGVRTPMLLGDAAGARFLLADALEPDDVAAAVIDGMREERFLILPHADVTEHVRRKAQDYDRWLAGMRRLRTRIANA